MIQPLQKKDKVALISPSGKVQEEHIKKNVKLLESWGLTIVFGKYCFNAFNKMAATDEDRLADLQWALDDLEIKAVFCTRGGYGLARIIDKVNWRKFTSNPKFIIGFSDVTLLHSQVNRLGFPSIHAPMPNSYDSTPLDAIKSLKKALFESTYQYPSNLFKNNEVVGGNLSIIYSLLGTDLDIDTKNKILFLEEINEYAYHVDRMFLALKKAGKFNGIKGMALGYFTDIKEDNFGLGLKEIVSNATKEYDFPVDYDLNVGHEANNHAIVFGKKY